MNQRNLALSMLGILALGAASGCASSQKAKEEDASEPVISTEASQLGDSDSGKALGLVSIPFGYRAFELSEDTKALLRKNAATIKVHSSTMVEIEGHCDVRGGPRINMALGDKRAREVKRYLISQGVDPMKLTAISYGDSRPLAKGSDEASMKQNRRVNFLIISR